MMKKYGFSLLVVVAALAAMNGAALGATWTLVGASPHTVGTIIPESGETIAETYMSDVKRIKSSGVVVDAAGNVYAITNDWENNPASTPYPDRNGGVTIFKADGSIVGVNLRALGYPGALTKLAVAGDGKVYALQNWTEIDFGYARAWDHKILRINPTGTVDLIVNATNWSPSGTNDLVIDMIRAMTVGEGGHVYFIMKTPNGGYYEQHMLWRYNVTSAMIEPAPRDPLVDEGWGASSALLYSFEYVGNGWYVIVPSGGNSIDAIRWDMSRRIILNGVGNSSWEEKITALGYDPLRTNIWAFERGQSGGTDFTAIAWRLSGTLANGSLLTTYDIGLDKVLGVDNTKTATWHVNRNSDVALKVPPETPELNKGKYWCQAFAINPADGKAWMAWSGDKCMGCGTPVNYVGNIGTPNPPGDFGYVGMVYTADTDAGATYASEGAPLWDSVNSRPSGYVMALGFGKRNGSCYAFALTLDKTTAAYALYSAPVACPAEGACCTNGNACQVTSSQACTVAGGVYSGDNTTCTPNTCNVMGACCQKANVCTSEMQTRCTELGGNWNGEGSDCELQDCRFQVCQTPVSDTDGDNDVDQDDFAIFQQCLTVGGGTAETTPPCSCLDVDGAVGGGPDGQIDSADFAPFTICGSGPKVPVPSIPACQ